MCFLLCAQVFRDLFADIIESDQVFGALLKRIKTEYETFYSRELYVCVAHCISVHSFPRLLCSIASYHRTHHLSCCVVLY
jgi:hypothetical protein